MITIVSNLPEYVMSGSVPEFSIHTTKEEVTFLLKLADDDEFILQEKYVPDADGLVVFRDLNKLFEAYLNKNLIEKFAYALTDGGDAVGKEIIVQYCTADMDMPAEEFLDNYFLSMMEGHRVTAPSRQEYLHLVCRENTEVIVDAVYSDGEVVSAIQARIEKLNAVQTVEVSPSLFELPGKTLRGYTVRAGSREQIFRVDRRGLKSAPDLIFTNSFGCQETFYCTGTYQMEAQFDREMAYIKGKYKAYSIQETRTYKANTGILINDMANWGEDLLRSKEIFLLHGDLPGKEITITDSKLVRDNTPDELPSFNFEYRYAQRNHNLFSRRVAGRIFDLSFDRTFN